MNITQSIIIYVVGLVLILLLAKILAKPAKLILKLLFNTIIGGVILILINTVGGIWNFSLGVNPITAAIVGVLGIPGVILLILLKVFFL